ncbi:tripartite tricarboxylate transporter substrate-binding protein [Microbispora sp. ATCC PTA-5024]|uniref:tripartite tricarboxylate transporter substrate-binding protein n=1 Tax=Microbispora sp. ATCC PTA-5024 TaxID=316330 RepID=UPI0003F80F7C|nr:tripartite tricarboxylate transporter substrate-binding protein [Microbispora sp. ATCC PTA-5024]
MRRRTVLALGVLALAAGCGTQAPPYQSEISLVVPGSSGGWGDSVAGELRTLIEGRRWARTVRVAGRGGEGAAAVARFVSAGRRTDLLVTDPALLAAAAMSGARPLLGRTAPLARLVGEWEVLVTSPDSPYRGFDRLAAALVKDPSAVPLAGGPSGGADHLLAGMVALGLGADVRLLGYTAFDDRRQAVAAVLDGRVPLAFGTPRDVADHVRAGRLRPLAVSSSERLDGLDAPTLSESGVRAVYADWAGLVAPAALTGGARDALLDLCAAVAGSAGWQGCCGRNGWAPMYLAGDDFGRWLSDEVRRTSQVLDALGLR